MPVNNLIMKLMTATINAEERGSDFMGPPKDWIEPIRAKFLHLQTYSLGKKR